MIPLIRTDWTIIKLSNKSNFTFFSSHLNLNIQQPKFSQLNGPMYVFPAFDDNYKTRKRVYRCCERCRDKRIKCKISSLEALGCDSCKKSSTLCSLVKKPVDGTTNGSYDGSDIALSSTYSSLLVLQDMTTVTPQFLKKNFRFNVSNMLDERAYQYVFHDHPKVLITSKTTADKSLYHESGIHVDYLRPSRKKPKLNHIKDRRTFQYLLSINAFSITSGEFAFTEGEVNELVEIYLKKVQPILPMIGEQGYREESKKGIVPTILMYAIVLLILKDTLARPIMARMFAREPLRKDQLYEDNYLEWSFQLDNKIRQVILVLPQLGDFDKYTRLSTLLLLSLYFGFDRFGNEKALHDLTDAVNMAFLLGIHMRRQLLELDEERVTVMNALWWCVFVLDRFNALVNCRSLFIRQNDFNLDLPKNMNLLKLVQVARSLENMLYDVYRPFQPGSNHLRGEVYKLDEFQVLEFQYCHSEQLQVEANKKKDPSAPKYLDLPPINFITRIVNNAIILASQKKKYDDPTVPNNIPESYAFRSSQNIMWYILHQSPDSILNIPIIPWCLTLALSVCLKRRAKVVLNYGHNDRDASTITDQWLLVDTPPYEWKDFLVLLEPFTRNYWVVDEIYKLSVEFGCKLEAKREKQEGAIKKRKLAESTADPTSKYDLTSESRVPLVSESSNGVNISATLTPIATEVVPSSSKLPVYGGVVENLGDMVEMPTNGSKVVLSGLNGIASTEIPGLSGVSGVSSEVAPNGVSTIPGTNSLAISSIASAGTPSAGMSSSILPKSTSLENVLSYDDYFGSLQIDIFDNDWFMELPNVQNSGDSSSSPGSEATLRSRQT